MNTNDFITIDNFNKMMIRLSAPQVKYVKQQPQSSQPQQQYQEIPVEYNYGTPENPILKPLMFQLPKMVTSSGIMEQPEQNGKISSSIMVNIRTTSDPNQKKLFDCLTDTHTCIALLLENIKSQVGLHQFEAEFAIKKGYGLKHPYYIPIDKTTSKQIQGKDPSMYLKLFSRGREPYVEQTIFTGLDNKPVEWKFLKSVEMEFIPLINVEKIYVGGGKASLQIKLISAVVLSVKAKGSFSKQSSTIQQLVGSDPSLLDRYRSELDDLRNRLLNMNSPSSNNNNNNNNNSNNSSNTSNSNSSNSTSATTNPSQPPTLNPVQDSKLEAPSPPKSLYGLQPIISNNSNNNNNSSSNDLSAFMKPNLPMLSFSNN